MSDTVLFLFLCVLKTIIELSQKFLSIFPYECAERGLLEIVDDSFQGTNGFSSVGDGVFLVGCEFCYCFVELWQEDDWVVAKAA